MVVCNMPFHMSETPEQNRPIGNIILKKLSFSFKDNCHSENMKVRLKFIKGCIASFHILYVFSARMLLLV